MTRRLLQKLVLQDAICLSAISFFEIAILVQRRRALSSLQPSELRMDFLASGGKELAIDGDVAIRAGDFRALSDPFDRLIMATADVRGLRLLTADEQILEWAGDLDRLDART
jgi:PIN domain nuclease of toxin-antitoxin system